jgi:hypothetical protein
MYLFRTAHFRSISWSRIPCSIWIQVPITMQLLQTSPALSRQFVHSANFFRGLAPPHPLDRLLREITSIPGLAMSPLEMQPVSICVSLLLRSLSTFSFVARPSLVPKRTLLRFLYGSVSQQVASVISTFVFVASRSFVSLAAYQST